MQTYPTMKDSGLKYLGDIPDEWNLLRASVLFKKNKQTNTDLLSVEPMQFKLGEIINKKIDVDEKTKEEIRRYTVVEKDDIILNGLNLNYDFLTQRVAIVKKSGCITPAYISMRTRKNILPMYATYLLKALDGQKVLNGWGTGIRLTLNYSEFKKYYLPAPSIDTQQRIIDYLDEETALIDDLIAKQQRLLELLEEKRRATINTITTTGVGRNNLIDTGNKYLGAIPKGWKFEKSKYNLSFNKGLNITKADLTEAGVPVINYGQVHSKYPVHFNPNKDTLPFVPEKYLDIENAIMKKGDFIFADTSEDYDGSGNFSMLTTEAVVLAGYHSVIARIMNDNLLPEYLAYYFASDKHRNQIRTGVSGVKVFSITQQLLKNTFILIPPKDEQCRIVEYIEKYEAGLGIARRKILKQIDLLKERRTSLISSAVTGKIKI